MPSSFSSTSQQEARLIPVRRELLCDGDTALAIYLRLRGWARERQRENGDLHTVTMLLESVGGQERWARYSVVLVGCRARIRGFWRHGHLDLQITPAPGFNLPEGVKPSSQGLAALENLWAAYQSPLFPQMPRFWGGLVGIWGYDAVRFFSSSEDERSQGTRRLQKSQMAQSPLSMPTIELIASDTVVVFDNFSQRMHVIATACPATEGGYGQSVRAAEKRLEAVIAALHRPERLDPRALHEDLATRTPAMNHAYEVYTQAVARAREYICAGDIFQVVLSQCFDSPRGTLDPLEIYRQLRLGNPAPYMYILEFSPLALVGASPEVLVRVEGSRGAQRIIVRPIAGTRPRGLNESEDHALEQELLADEKERAEHLMLIDLGRNDVGRVCKPGTVCVPQSFIVERYSKVMHIVSEIQGELQPELSALDALRATFPAGTLSGAPKIRALEIIDELEAEPRGWYGGAVGYLGYDGAADFAICIRSVVIDEVRVRVQAGAGIVFDSNPQAEHQECINKASAVLRAVALARSGMAKKGEGTNHG